MVLLERNVMEQIGMNTQIKFNSLGSAGDNILNATRGIKQESALSPTSTSPLSDKENLQNSTCSTTTPGGMMKQDKKRSATGLYTTNSSSSSGTPKTSHHQSGAVSKPKVVQMGRRNARERNRVRYLNMTFEHLRQHLPSKVNSKGKAKKMSKVDTLRGAIDYIRGLQELLDESDAVNAVFQSGSLNTALSEADTLSPTHSTYSTDGSPCSLTGQSPPDFNSTPRTEYSMSTTGDSVLFSEEDGDDLIDITSWFQC